MQSEEILKLLRQQPLADTHEHLLEESSRLARGNGYALDDIGLLFSHYGNDDLRSAGMPLHEVQAILQKSTPADRKWEMIRPCWERIRLNGYGRTIRETVRCLYGVEDLDDSTWQTVNTRIGELIKPGYYQRVLREVARIDHCQVHSLEAHLLQESATPDLLRQDLKIMALSTDPDIPQLQADSGITIRTLDDFISVIDWAFEKFGPKAVAVKNYNAYQRRLDFDQVPVEDARRHFEAYAKGGFVMDRARRKPIEDFLLHYCIDRATLRNLPVKLHTGYFVGNDYMPLARLATNMADACDLCMRHPKARFVFLHVGWPFQDQAIALAKHYTNAWIEMSWSWMFNPRAAGRFLTEMLSAAPANKVFVFGGDLGPVELVAGHAEVARQGIANALAGMVAAGEMSSRDVERLLPRLCCDNAREFFGIKSS